MINTIKELLESIRIQGINEISKFSHIKHGPTIGDMYEGLTKEMLNKAIFKDLNLKVCSGFICNRENELSKQIDCMIVVGDGIEIPYIKAYKYDISQVIAVIEVKKDLFGKEMDLSYKNLLSVKNIIKPDHDMEIDIFEQAYENVTGRKLPNKQELDKMAEEEQYLYHALLVESYMPIRIAFGYGGFSTEQSLRRAFIDYMSSNTKVKGYSVSSIPSLIVADQNSILKTNGIPFAISIKNQEKGEWGVLGSANRAPILLLLYLIWTRLYYLFPDLPEEIFDNTEIFINPLMKAKGRKEGWEYTFIEGKLEYSNEEMWKPLEITLMSNILLKMIEKGYSITLDNKFLIEECVKNGEVFSEVIKDLVYKRIVCVDNSVIRVLSDNWITVIYNGKYYFGDNFNNRMIEWCNNLIN
jgi:hypothetical protein